jgi:Zn-dependent peptidase ImmA (M78 family)
VTADRERARADARALIAECQIVTTPVPVERIARRLGVKVKYAPLDGDISGMAYIADDVSIIGVNSLQASSRQRFTLAHELGHIRLHVDLLREGVHLDHGTLRRDWLSSQGTDPREIEANAFASELLMPEPLMLAALDGRTVDLEDDNAIDVLARRFRVSSSAMRYRLVA